jgi:RNA polymerase sigma-70 factor (ECF subfamily)
MIDQSSGEDLVRRAKGGDVQAFGHLYDRTIRLVRAVAADAGREAAEDVAHEAYLRAYRNLGTLNDPTRFAAWLVGITRLIVRERKRARRFEPLPHDIQGASEPDRTGDDDTEVLLRAVARLPEEERLAIRFFFLNERSIDETARLLDRSRSGTYSVLQSAKAKLARWLRECGVNR